MEVFTIKKVIGNNVVVVERASKDYILTGKGIGFAKKPGEKIMKNSTIEKIFVEHMDKDIIEATEEIITMAEESLGEKLNQYIHIDLLDHISFTIYRLGEKMDLVNPFLAETQILYAEEFALAQKAGKILEERLRIKIPDSEIGFITLHLHSARANCKVTQTLRNTSFLTFLVAMVEEELVIKLPPNSSEYARLINHLKYAIERIEKDRFVINLVLDRLKDDLYNEYKIASKIGNSISDYLGKAVPEDEIGYITLHLYRLKNYINNR